jgi:hypothetical protein
MKLYTSKDLQVKHKYEKTHYVEKVFGTEVDLTTLNKDQLVIWGDGATYHYLLTKKL